MPLVAPAPAFTSVRAGVCFVDDHQFWARAQELVPARIVFLLSGEAMTAAVCFQHQPRFRAVEIKIKLAHRRLPAEFVTGKPAMSQEPSD